MVESGSNHTTNDMSENAGSVTPPSREPYPVARREHRKRQKLILLISGGVVLVLLLLGAAYWLFSRDKDKAVQTTTSEQKPTTQTPAAQPADSTPVTFKSKKYNIELTHPKDWNLKEAQSGAITITSPQTSYAKTDGQSATGVFTVKFRVGVTDAQKATIEKAVATRDSEVIAYDKPTENQRYYTNLSYAGQKDIFNFFIVTGNSAIKKGNSFAYTMPLDDGGFYMLVGGFGADPKDTLAFDSVPPSAIDNSTVQQAIAIVKSLKIY